MRRKTREEYVSVLQRDGGATHRRGTYIYTRARADGRTHSDTHAFARMQKHSDTYIDMHTHTPM